MSSAMRALLRAAEARRKRRRPAVDRALGTRRWRRIRAALLARSPLCARCLEDGLTAAATEVDHIVPRSRGGAVFDRRNLQPLCSDCHRRKTDAERPDGRRRLCARHGFDERSCPLCAEERRTGVDPDAGRAPPREASGDAPPPAVLAV